jgi:hypothetical protein
MASKVGLTELHREEQYGKSAAVRWLHYCAVCALLAFPCLKLGVKSVHRRPEASQRVMRLLRRARLTYGSWLKEETASTMGM